MRGRDSPVGTSAIAAINASISAPSTTPSPSTTPRSSAYIKIAEGCDHPCTFCIIPQLRGQFRSRRFESVLAEAERLAHGGVREITLIGQDTTCYGEDLGIKDGLAQLLASAGTLAHYNGLIAESIEMPADRSWVAFTLRQEARFHDGSPITVDDVIWTFQALKTKGHPFYRSYFAQVLKAGQAWRMPAADFKNELLSSESLQLQAEADILKHR